MLFKADFLSLQCLKANPSRTANPHCVISIFIYSHLPIKASIFLFLFLQWPLDRFNCIYWHFWYSRYSICSKYEKQFQDGNHSKYENLLKFIHYRIGVLWMINAKTSTISSIAIPLSKPILILHTTQLDEASNREKWKGKSSHLFSYLSAEVLNCYRFHRSYSVSEWQHHYIKLI